MSIRGSIALRPGKTPNSLEIEASIPFRLNKEEGGVTAYTPFLDFCTCGRDQDDAAQMFEKGVMVFLKELVRMGTLDEFLREQGWRKSPLPKKPDRWVPPELIWRQQKLRTAVPLSA